MKILTISHMFPTKQKPHYGNFVRDQIIELEMFIDFNTIIIPKPYFPFIKNTSNFDKINSEAYFKKYNLDKKIDYINTKYIALPKKMLFNISGRLMYYNYMFHVHKKMKDFDLIHAHVALPDGQFALKMSKLTKKPYIITIHGQDLQVSIKDKKSKKIIREILLKSSGIIFVSEKLKGIFEREFPDIASNQKYISIPNGYNSDYNIELERKYDNKIRIVSVSNLKKSKGIIYNLKALKKLQDNGIDFKYEIIGEGPEREKLESFVSKNKINNVLFHGFQDKDEIIEIFKRSDIFSLPSFEEGFGISYLEAMASGLPVISVINEGISPYLPESLKYEVNPHNEDDIYNYLKKYMYLSPNEKKVLSKKVSDFVRLNYSWKVNAEKSYKFILKCMEDK